MFKRFYNVLFSILISLLMFTNVFCDTIYIEGSFSYTIKDGKIEILKYFGDDEKVEIPSNINSMPVTSIASGAFKDTEAKNVTIPATVVNIEEGAFSSDVSHQEIKEPEIEDKEPEKQEEVEEKEPQKQEEEKEVLNPVSDKRKEDSNIEIEEINEIDEAVETGDVVDIVDVDDDNVPSNNPGNIHSYLVHSDETQNKINKPIIYTLLVCAICTGSYFFIKKRKK